MASPRRADSGPVAEAVLPPESPARATVLLPSESPPPARSVLLLESLPRATAVLLPDSLPPAVTRVLLTASTTPGQPICARQPPGQPPRRWFFSRPQIEHERYCR